jgi:hypothetical protein
MVLILGPLFPILWLRLMALVTETVNVGWEAPAGLADILGTVFITFALNRAPQPWETIGAWVLAALAALGLLALLRFRFSDIDFSLNQRNNSALAPQREAGGYSVLVIMLWLLPIAVLWLVTLKVPIFQARYLIMALPAYLIMVAAGLFVLRRLHSLAVAVAVALIAAVTFVALTGVNYSAAAQKEDWRGAMIYVQDHVRLRDVIVVFPGYLKSAVEVYYEPGGPALIPERPVRTVPSLETEGFGARELDRALKEIVTCNERAWLIV